MRESLQKIISQRTNFNRALFSTEIIDEEVDALTAAIRSSAFQSKTTETHILRKMPWWNRKLYGCRNNLRQVRSNFQKTPNIDNCRKVQQLKNEYQREVRKSKWSSWKLFCSTNFNNNPFSTLRRLAKQTNKVTNDLNQLLYAQPNRTTLEVLQEIGNHFFPDRNITLTNTQENIVSNVEEFIPSSPEVSFTPEITKAELHSAIFSSSGKKAPGIDGIQAWILQEFYVILKPILLRIVVNTWMK